MNISRPDWLWMCCLLVLTAAVSCRVQNPTTVQLTATDQAQTHSATKRETDAFAPPASASDPSVPLIVSIDFPDRITSASEPGLGQVQFSDANGDVHSVQFTLLDGGCMDFEFFAFDPLNAMQSGNRFAGIFQFQQSCKKCTDSGGDQILMRVQLYDRSGRESAPVDYAFMCE